MTFLLFILLAVAGALYHFARISNKKLLDTIKTLEEGVIIKAAREEASAIVARAEAEKAVILENANEQSENLLSTAKNEGKGIISISREKAYRLTSEADKTIAEVDAKAATIIAQAKAHAEEIAGDAYKALKSSAALSRTAKAMKNIIDGYGDQYLIPATTLIDDLAEDFSHTDAGSKLKGCRDRTRQMVKNRSAAACDYVEANRKDTAIDFVLDAFNGKVDSILSSVKAENFGTLSQKISDSFETVNHNGSAFRNARITEIYLANRLEELKWACTSQALKDQLKEEQRQIREQMREEEKAVREIEKALKDAQKEEDTLLKAMEKVRKELEGASEQQRLKYEAKLAEYQAKLVEAEEKNKRALSMAQQTRRGHVYVISNVGSFGENVIKVGMTRRLEPQDRIDELGDASVPFDFDVHAMIFSEDAPKLEKELHAKFALTQLNKVNPRKEFFKLEMQTIRTAIESMGVQTQWTMAAEAKEYRESLAAVERAKSITVKAS